MCIRHKRKHKRHIAILIIDASYSDSLHNFEMEKEEKYRDKSESLHSFHSRGDTH